MPNKYKTLFYKLLSSLFDLFAAIRWPWIQSMINGGKYYRLTEYDQLTLQTLFVKDHYIILTRRSCHLTTYLIWLGSLLTTGKGSYWSHACMNIEGDDIKDEGDFRIMEAIGQGSKVSEFMEVFDCDAVAVLAPVNMDTKDWTAAITEGLQELGRPYDDLFDLNDNSHVSCVELCRDALKATPNYNRNFSQFEKMISDKHNLTPQMFYDCPDFKVVFEVRR